jgi:hypothetical protein
VAYPKGAKRSHPAKLALAKDAASHPSIYVLPVIAPQTARHPVNWLPPCEDQGQTSECTAHALSQGLYAACGARGVSLGFQGPPSPRHFYSCSGGIARAAADPTGALPPLQDDGRELADCITALMACGAVAMGPLAPDGRFSDSTPENATDEPSVQALEDSAHACLAGAYTVDLTAANALDVCAAALDSGRALYLGFDCGDTFEALGPGDIAQPTPASDPNQGGHALTVVSYRVSAAGQREFLIRNSWGNGWADMGNVWASSAWLLACWEVWVLDESLLSKVTP